MIDCFVSIFRDENCAELSPDDDKELKSKCSVIRVHGDGRCLFRCAAIHGVQALRNTMRSHFTGLAIDSNLQDLEQLLSDRIRNEVLEAVHAEQVQLETVQFDLPFLLDAGVRNSYKSLAQRLEMMARPNEYAGYLECLALSFVSGRQVRIYEERKDHYHLMAKFPMSSTENAETVNLLYQMDRTNQDGHFDLIIHHSSKSNIDYWTVSCYVAYV